MLMMRVTPKMSDRPAPTRNRLDAAASPLSAWNRRASRLIGPEPGRAANSVCSLPPCGGGVGRGGVRGMLVRQDLGTPTPNPSPQGGGERTESAALICRQGHENAPQR